MLYRTFLAVALLVGFAAQTNAEMVVIGATDVGSYFDFSGGGGGYSANESTVGNWSGLAFEHRNFAIFDLSGVTDTIISAKLRTNSGPDVLRISDVVVDFRSYSGSIAALTAGTAGFSDLASGGAYGAVSLPSAFPDDAVVDVVLNTAAISDLDGSTGLFAIAGSQTVPTLTSGVFAGVGRDKVSLILEVKRVPEPTSFALFSLALVGMAHRRRQR